MLSMDDGRIYVGRPFLNPETGRDGIVERVERFRRPPDTYGRGRFLVEYGRFRRWHRLEEWEVGGG